jgi:hypothetical protein
MQYISLKTRYAFTVISNIFVYGVTFILLQYTETDDHPIIPIDTSTSADIPIVDNNLNPKDAPKFMILTFIVCGVGLVSQLIFHIGTKETCDGEQVVTEKEREERERTKHFVMQTSLDWRGYLKTIRFYQVRSFRSKHYMVNSMNSMNST